MIVRVLNFGESTHNAVAIDAVRLVGSFAPIIQMFRGATPRIVVTFVRVIRHAQIDSAIRDVQNLILV